MSISESFYFITQYKKKAVLYEKHVSSRFRICPSSDPIGKQARLIATFTHARLIMVKLKLILV